MPLHTNLAARERILSTGGPGSGKSFDLLTIARWSIRTGSPAKFTIVDTDRAVPRMIETEFPELLDHPNLHVVEADEWSIVAATTKHATRSMAPDDWFAVDLLSSTWDMVQAHFAEQVFGTDIENYFMNARAAQGANTKGGASGFEGWTDWPVINKLYKGFMNDILRAKGHVYCTAVADTISDTTEAEIKATFGSHGVKPKGQKHTAHFFHSCLIKRPIGDSLRLVTAKDRGREYQAGTECRDFVMDYLVKVAGWGMGA